MKRYIIPIVMLLAAGVSCSKSGLEHGVKQSPAKNALSHLMLLAKSRPPSLRSPKAALLPTTYIAFRCMKERLRLPLDILTILRA